MLKKTKLFYLFSLLILITGISIMSTAASSNNDFTSYKRPWFTIEFTSTPMGVDIRLNDIPVFNIDNTGFMTLEVAANEYIINGDNELKIITFPLFDDEDEQDDDYIKGASIDVALYVREDGESTDKRKLISKATITPGNAYLEPPHTPVAFFTDTANDEDHTPITIKKDASTLDFPGYGKYKKQVTSKWTIKNMKSSLPHWQWQDGDQIKNNDDTYQSLLKAYASLHKAFLNKDLSMVKKISQPRSKELATAYYLSDEDAGFEYSALGKDIDSPTIKLYEELALGHSKLDIFANGKLARIIDGGDIQPILFIDSETGQYYQHQFKWQRNKNNAWVLIR